MNISFLDHFIISDFILFCYIINGTIAENKSNDDAEDNIQSVCRSLRLRAIHAMDHLQDINKTVCYKGIEKIGEEKE